MALTAVAVAKHAAMAGWRGPDLPVAVAVAFASSGGWPDRTGGLWGLPGEAGGDPAGNATKAYARWRALGWGGFGGYTSTKYLLFMPLAVPAVAHPDVVAIIAGPAVQDAIGGLKEAAGKLPGADVLDTARGALGLAVKAGAWVSDRHNWVRIAQVFIGGGMVIAAVAMVARPDQKLSGFIGSTSKALGKVL